MCQKGFPVSSAALLAVESSRRVSLRVTHVLFTLMMGSAGFGSWLMLHVGRDRTVFRATVDVELWCERIKHNLICACVIFCL